MPKPRLVAPLLRVVTEDGAEHEVQATNADMLTYERTARKRGWPDAKSAPVEWVTFLAWHALVRDGAIPSDTTYDGWCLSVLSVEPVGGEPVDPTRPGAEDG